MKLANLFLITGLVSVLAAIGCSSDPQQQNGGGGSGGNGTADLGCDEGRCLDAAQATKCENGIAACAEAELVNEQECIAGGNFLFCNDDGAGGAGGAGGTGVPPDENDVCDEGLCEDPGTAQDRCKELLTACVEFALESQWDECVAVTLIFVCEVEPIL